MQQLIPSFFKRIEDVRYIEIEMRRDEIDEIEEDVEEILFINQELNNLINIQGKNIIYLGDNINNAHDNVESATDNIKEVNDNKTKSRWRKGILIFSGSVFTIGTIILLILI